MKLVKKIVSVFLISVILSGCAHPLTMQNISSYKASFINSEYTNSTIGLSAVTSTPEEERLVTAIANNLKKNGFRVIFPYYQNANSSSEVDYTAKINASSDFRGSGSNFFVNWPGFLIFAPAIFGYSYTAKLNFDVDIIDVKNNRNIPRVNIPIELFIKHADINRTWTEISWLEVSIIAFIGGLCFMSYDKTVTPLVIDATENKLGDYVASKISSTIVSINKTNPKI